jgi:hypothetical protein
MSEQQEKQMYYTAFDAFIRAQREKHPRTKSHTCRYCGLPLNWASQRQQFGRALGYGLTPEQAKQFGPACGKCTTERLSPWRSQQPQPFKTLDQDIETPP